MELFHSHTKRKNMLAVLKNRALRRELVLMGEEITGEWAEKGIMTNFFNQYC